MTERKESKDKLFESLRERAKELDCLYQIEKILSDPDRPLDEVCPKIIEVIPSGWQYPDVCRAKISVENNIYCSPDFVESAWMQSAGIGIKDSAVGRVTVGYIQERPAADDGPFLREETKLIRAIAGQLGSLIEYQRLSVDIQELQKAAVPSAEKRGARWQKVLEILEETDRELFLNITRKLKNHLCMSGIADAERFLQPFGSEQAGAGDELREDWNVPHHPRKKDLSGDFSSLALRIAAEHLSDDTIQSLIQKWLQEDKLSALERIISGSYSLSEIANAIERFYPVDDETSPSASKKGIRVSLIRRFLSDQLQYIKVARDFIGVRDVSDLLERVISCAESKGKLGGKSAGMHLAAHILEEKGKNNELLGNVKIPKTWHITSDAILHFVRYNGLDDVVEQKYKELDQIYAEYPYIVQTFKCARFPAEIINGLTMALDDFGEHPLIVRSSSLLEDRVGAAFSGKYRSLFLGNQGSRHDRLDALIDAVAEVYASTFSPDAIEYRAERGLLDFVEEMGIMIQEVVGTTVGKYFLPTFAGVAFSANEFRWSPRIRREDGLVRLVPGMGTRAVDRVGDDYPALIAPGQPGLSVNVGVDEIVRYSPKKIDVINLQTNSFETLDIEAFLKEVGEEIPGLNDIVSILHEDGLIRPVGLTTDLSDETSVVTFEGLFRRTPFIKQIQTILRTLEQEIGTPVDIEFGSDGHNLYLLQCRPQSSSDQSAPAPIPRDVPKGRIVFSANRYVSNGSVPDITHIVYVVGSEYEKLASRSEMVSVGRAVGKLNKLLPKRKFILMGPGRWGSRGDIKLGVNVTYSDINNTAVLIEVARKKGDYVPDLSFGTHFFQDLVEANIRYLPLYPDDTGIVFDEQFLDKSHNILADILPEFAWLSDTVRVIDVPGSIDGMVLKVLLNADLDEAMGLLAPPSQIKH